MNIILTIPERTASYSSSSAEVVIVHFVEQKYLFSNDANK